MQLAQPLQDDNGDEAQVLGTQATPQLLEALKLACNLALFDAGRPQRSIRVRLWLPSSLAPSDAVLAQPLQDEGGDEPQVLGTQATPSCWRR